MYISVFRLVSYEICEWLRLQAADQVDNVARRHSYDFKSSRRGCAQGRNPTFRPNPKPGRPDTKPMGTSLQESH